MNDQSMKPQARHLPDETWLEVFEFIERKHFGNAKADAPNLACTRFARIADERLHWLKRNRRNARIIGRIRIEKAEDGADTCVAFVGPNTLWGQHLEPSGPFPLPTVPPPNNIVELRSLDIWFFDKHVHDFLCILLPISFTNTFVDFCLYNSANQQSEEKRNAFVFKQICPLLPNHLTLSADSMHQFRLLEGWFNSATLPTTFPRRLSWYADPIVLLRYLTKRFVTASVPSRFIVHFMYITTEMYQLAVLHPMANTRTGEQLRFRTLNSMEGILRRWNPNTDAEADWTAWELEMREFPFGKDVLALSVDMIGSFHPMSLRSRSLRR